LIRSGTTGLSVPPRDPAALASALDRLLTDRDLAASCADAAFEQVRGMTWTRTAERTLEVYQKAISARRHAG
jgi:glycosyltransferase involved in cell wall biosynthesis